MAITKEQLEQFLTDHGYEKDRFGHFKKEMPRKNGSGNSLFRYKMNKYSVRYEVRARHSDGSASWIRLRGGYYKNLRITEEGKLAGMTL